MTIQVRLFATLRHGRDKILSLELPDGSSVADIATSLAIAPSDIAILLVGGRDAPLDRILADGDVVSIFPPVGGG